MDAATRDYIRRRRDEQRRRTHPWVPERAILASYDGRCPRCGTEFEPGHGRIWCSERCRKAASLRRTRGRRAKT